MVTQVELVPYDVMIELAQGVSEFDTDTIQRMLATDRIGDESAIEFLKYELPSSLYERLRGDPQKTLLAARSGRDHQGLPRLVLAADPGADDCPAALPWELLARHDNLGDRNAAIVRRVGSRPARRPLPTRRRALIVIGDYSQGGEQAHEAVRKQLESLTTALAKFADVTLVTMMPTTVFGRHPGVRELESSNALLAELKNGYEIVHFIGHSRFQIPEDARELSSRSAPRADRIGLIVQESRMHPELHADDIGAALAGGPTRLVVMDCCYAHRHFAGPILASAEHFIGMSAMVPVEFGRLWTPTFYGELAKGRSVTSALQHAREAVRESESLEYRHLDFVPCHWSASADDHPFGSPAELRLCDYVESLRQHETKRTNPILGRSEEDIQHVELHFGDSRKTAYELITRAARWMLLGDPGTGKTATLRHLTRAISTAKPDAPVQQLVPVLVSLPDLPESLGSSMFDSIVAHLVSGMPESDRRENVTTALLQPPESCLLVFLIDGLDEAPAKGGEVIRALSQAYPEHAILVACRENGRGLLGDDLGFEHTLVQPLRRNQQVQVLASALRAIWPEEWDTDPEAESRAKAAEMLDSLGKDFAQLAALPLFLTLFALLRDQLQHNQGRRELLLNSIDTLLHERHRHRRNEQGWPKGPSALRLLEAMAIDLTALGKRSASEQWLRRFITFGGMQDTDGAPELARLRKHLGDSGRCEVEVNFGQFDSVDQFLRECRKRGLLDPDDDDESHATWKFAHKSFQEVLASNVLNRMPEGMNDLFTLLSGHLGPRSRLPRAEETSQRQANMIATWAEPLAFWVASAEYPDVRHKRVRRLLDLHPDLAFRAATYAYINDPKLVQDLLAAGGIDKPLLRRLESLTSDNFCIALAAIAELEQQRSPERSFDADHALAEIVARDTGPEGRLSQAALRSQAAREEMWDRYPLDPEQWNRVPGRTDLTLWSRIAADSARALPNPFWIMRVPVTRAMFRLFEATDTREADDPNRPAICRWRAARSFADWLNHHRGTLFKHLRDTRSISVQVTEDAWEIRLPTAAEWRHAASGGSGARFVNGVKERDLERYAICTTRAGDVPDGPLPVASRASSDNGLFDVQGNVMEWVAGTVTGPLGIYREALGGSYKSLAGHCALDRSVTIPDETQHGRDWQAKYTTGLRLVIARQG